MSISVFFRRLPVLVAALGLSVSAYGQANLIFGGGNGSPITMTLTSPVTYTVTQTTPQAPVFGMDAVGNAFALWYASSGTLTFTINGGPARAISVLGSNSTMHDLTPDDAFIYGGPFGVTLGDIILLQPGSLTTSANVAASPPAGGVFATFVTDFAGNRLSPNGVAVPEPSVWALMIVGGVGAAGTANRRRPPTSSPSNSPVVV